MRNLTLTVLLLGALAPLPQAHAGEMLLLETTATSGALDAKTTLRRVDPSPRRLLDTAATSMRVSAALATPDGTDLLLIGRTNDGQVQLLRLGRIGTGKAPTGCDPPEGSDMASHNDCYVPLFGPIPLSLASTHLPTAAWLKDHVAVVMGQALTKKSVFIYPAYDDSHASLPGSVLSPKGEFDVSGLLSQPPRLLAATADGSRLYVSDGQKVLRLDISVDGRGGYSIRDRQDFSPTGGGTILALASTSDGGALLGMSASGMAYILRMNSDGLFSRIGDEVEGDWAAAVEVEGDVLISQAVSSGGVLRLWRKGASASIDVNDVEIGGSLVAAPGRLLLAGRNLLDSSDVGKPGYRLYERSDAALKLVGDADSGMIRALVAQPDPAFGLSQRTVYLDAAAAGRRFGQMYIYGAMGKTLRIAPQGGNCSTTEVHVGSATGPLLQSRPLASNSELLFLTQPRDMGEACWLALSATGSGAGALLRVEGTPPLGPMALVLDGSGSMSRPVKGKSGPTRLEALKEVLTRFLGAIGKLADAQITVVPFNQEVLKSPHGEGLTSSANYSESEVAKEIDALRASGATNIRGALEEAARRLDSSPTNARRTIVLMTDGEHNTYAGMPDEVARLADVKDALIRPAMGRNHRIDRLYAIGLTEAGAHPTLRTLVKEVNQATVPAHAVAGSVHPGHMSYADSQDQLDFFFTKVFWGYLDASQNVDPIVTLAPDEERTWPINLLPTDEELFVHVGNLGWWSQVPEASLVALVKQQGTISEIPVRCDYPGLGRHMICAPDPRQYGTQFLLRVKNRTSGDPRTVVVEVGGRSVLRMRGSPGQAIYRTGDKIRLRMALTSAGLPVPGGKGVPLRVTGQLSVPTSGLGSTLANAKISADAIAGAMSAVPGDQRSALTAKHALLDPAQLPGQRTFDVELFDDGLHGDGQAGDGVFGVEAAAQIPGIYRLVAHAEYQAGAQGWVREGAVQVEVQPALAAGPSIVSRELSFPSDAPGRLRVVLRPQDAQGNLLGPGQGSDMIVTQGGRRLPTQISEPPTLDGSYTIEVTGIQPDVPVVLALLGSGAAAYLAYEPLPVDSTTGCGGCRLGGAGRPAGGAAALILGLLALVRRRRR